MPNDAYPILENAYVWRERIKRKDGWTLLGRLQRNITSAAKTFTNDLLAPFNATSSLVPGSINIVDSGGATWLDMSDGLLYKNGSPTPTGSVNYATGVMVGPTANSSGAFSYYPNLPVMGIRNREQTGNTVDQQIFFDQVYAYIFTGGFFQEWQTGTTNTTWTGTDYQFFWTTNYWSNPNGFKIFWATNFNWSSGGGDPIRYTDGVSGWINFAPQVDATGNLLNQALILIPFRGRLLALNTWEGGAGTGINYYNRIRWAAIGTPITTTSTIFPTGINANAWRSDIQGQGGFLNIPTNEDIRAAGFVRDNLVIYCENSTWQLRYTGRTIAPFQIERINSEFGSYSTFSAIQFDTSLLGIGDKGIISCDSFKSERIDIKIPDLVFDINQNSNGINRVSGARDFVQRLAYWTYCDSSLPNNIYPTKRLLYNYENDSWAIFTDSLTTLGQFQPQTSKQWLSYPKLSWSKADFSWVDRPATEYTLTGGNTQGFVLLLDQQVSNDISLQVLGITGSATVPIIINSPLHNLYTETDIEGEFIGQVIQFSGFLPTDPYVSLNGGIFVANVVDINNFTLLAFNSSNNTFSIAVTGLTGTYLGAATITVLDNFNIKSKKFNYLDDGQKYQLGYIDILLDDTASGEITLNVYNDYNDDLATNQQSNEEVVDTFFNITIPTSAAGIGIPGGSKNWQRVFCPTQANFVTLEYTLSSLQMTTIAQSSAVEIFSQIIWSRPAGRMGITL